MSLIYTFAARCYTHMLSFDTFLAKITSIDIFLTKIMRIAIENINTLNTKVKSGIFNKFK